MEEGAAKFSCFHQQASRDRDGPVQILLIESGEQGLQFVGMLRCLMLGNFAQQFRPLRFLQVDVAFIRDRNVGMHEIPRQGMILCHSLAALQAVDRVSAPILLI
jgi:hypothetical protein